MLCLDIAWLTGTAFLARDPSDPTPEWPPQPDRIFSALVASWGLGGAKLDERAALEWLEVQEPPRLHLPESAHARDTVKVYVPPNDAKRDTVLPARRKRQERRFPAVALDPEAPVHLSLLWQAQMPGKHRDALDALARRTSYVGHSASLVRAAFREIEVPPDGLCAAQRAPYHGRLAELEALYKRHMDGEANARARPAMRRGTRPVAQVAARAFTSDTAHWAVFEHAGDWRPDLRAQAGLAEAMRLALMEAWTRVHEGTAPAWISGHEPDRSPARDAHLAIVPMANIGWQHSDGRMMGLALVPPAVEVSAWAASGPAAFARRQAFHRALARLGETDGEGRRILTLAPQGGRSWQWRLTPASSGLRSLDPARYVRGSRLWATATPVLLDRHLKSPGPPERSAEAKDMIRQACARAGLPDPAAVVLSMHSAVTCAPSARPAGGNPRWVGWARRKSFGGRAFVHVRLAFDEPVSGPILLGAGRFHGLGLFLPIREGRA
ncbi:type I-U CRISPR-associated protein Csb2 [Paralimibaculum aggregatum]|uniref:Type I-U CRISPR-associated protein Csb2 n=1 Tax=Paralimibaculum aggregatum TaxID=3036245 RepID=A0ABQ6LMX7_9RHOB|nr:type I-U CRISPR-associated protein Csb2 [Limibaculum sp. NKW23]GMG81625.1 type I-U CRISPR-associated protein Csb2 [Limibaculum sp. NKW23]